MSSPLFSQEKIAVSSEVKTICLRKVEGMSPFVVCLLINPIIDFLVLSLTLIGGNVN